MELVKIGREGVEMAKKVKFGIGFVTGRPNVCRIVNSYYNDMLEQVSKYKKEVELTIFILFDIVNDIISEEKILDINKSIKEQKSCGYKK